MSACVFFFSKMVRKLKKWKKHHHASGALGHQYCFFFPRSALQRDVFDESALKTLEFTLSKACVRAGIHMNGSRVTRPTLLFLCTQTHSRTHTHTHKVVCCLFPKHNITLSDKDCFALISALLLHHSDKGHAPNTMEAGSWSPDSPPPADPADDQII